MFDFIVFILFVVSIVLLTIENARLKVKYASLVRKTLESHLAHNLVIEQAKKAEDVDKEAFIKFLSESRDSAFQYIEDVQKQVKEFIDEVNLDSNNLDQSIKKLKTVLPRDENAWC